MVPTGLVERNKLLHGGKPWLKIGATYYRVYIIAFKTKIIFRLKDFPLSNHLLNKKAFFYIDIYINLLLYPLIFKSEAFL